MKGDRVEIVVDAGDVTKTYDVAATRAGRRVEVVTRRGIVEVSELTRSGTAVRTARFMASRVIALVEHPATANAARVPHAAGGLGGEKRRRAEGRASRRPEGAPEASGDSRARRDGAAGTARDG